MDELIEGTIDWLDNGGFPYFILGVIVLYFASCSVIHSMPIDE